MFVTLSHFHSRLTRLQLTRSGAYLELQGSTLNIRQVCQWLTVKNTSAYYEAELITVAKIFIAKTPGSFSTQQSNKTKQSVFSLFYKTNFCFKKIKKSTKQKRIFFQMWSVNGNTFLSAFEEDDFRKFWRKVWKRNNHNDEGLASDATRPGTNVIKLFSSVVYEFS